MGGRRPDSATGCMPAQIHDGFRPSLMDDTSRREGYVVRFDGATRQPKRNYYDAYYTSLAKTGASTYRLGFGYPMPDNSVGDFMVVRLRRRTHLHNRRMHACRLCACLLSWRNASEVSAERSA